MRDAVYELRRALGPAAREAVVASRDQVGLAGDGVRVDLREFRRLRAAGELEAALAVGDGMLLTGLDAEWVLAAREEHVADLTVLGALAARAEAAGDVAGAAGWVRRRAELEPLGEEAHRDLVRLLALGGDRAAALTAAGAFAERLRRELGIPPSATTRALVEEVRRGGHAPAPAGAAGWAPAAAAAPLPVPAPLTRTAAPAGRERALAVLEAAWADAASGALRVAVVSGEPGIGKTTVAGELARRLHARGAGILYGRCDELALLPFGPWVEALEHLLANLPEEEAAAWLAAHDGALARLLPKRSIVGAGLPEGPRERHLAFETVRALLEQCAARRPLALVLDDLHWADEDTLGLLRHLGRTALRAPMLLVLGAREAELTAAGASTLAELRREGPVTGVPLTGLDEDGVAAWCAGSRAAPTPRPCAATAGGRAATRSSSMRSSATSASAARGRWTPRRACARWSAGGSGGWGRAPAGSSRSPRRPGRSSSCRPSRRPRAGARGRPRGTDGALATGLVVMARRPGRFAFAHALVAETLVAGLPASRRRPAPRPARRAPRGRARGGSRAGGRGREPPARGGAARAARGPRPLGVAAARGRRRCSRTRTPAGTSRRLSPCWARRRAGGAAPRARGRARPRRPPGAAREAFAEAAALARRGATPASWRRGSGLA